ncbi:hypothetical protein [Pedobacter sp. JY14-1]|nr:hypothetical protein [Pedobacter sp. JY14-1]
MRVNPTDIVARRKRLYEVLKRKAAIAIVLLSLLFFIIKIVFL